MHIHPGGKQMAFGIGCMGFRTNNLFIFWKPCALTAMDPNVLVACPGLDAFHSFMEMCIAIGNSANVIRYSGPSLSSDDIIIELLLAIPLSFTLYSAFPI